MNKILLPLIVTVILAVVGVIADLLMKLAGHSRFVNWKLLGTAFLIYALAIVGWFYVFKHLKLATIGVYYGISSLLFLVVVGVVYFKEQLNVWEVLGILTAVLSLSLLWKFA
ncbi:MAG TPA: transporter [Candidatus Nanoarchaeia archaeon]|nr:transporter [Candidatus Nanoarchaeia archaeon]